VYIAGQIAVGQDGQIVGRGDVTAQATQVFENLGKALAAAGADWSHLVKITVYVTDAGLREEASGLRPQGGVRRRWAEGDQ